MWTRPLGETLLDVAGSLLCVNAGQGVVRATEFELRLPLEVRLRVANDFLVFCADVPAWRWQTDWDRPFGELRVRMQEAPSEGSDE
jgi:hypothetical protein